MRKICLKYIMRQKTKLRVFVQVNYILGQCHIMVLYTTLPLLHNYFFGKVYWLSFLLYNEIFCQFSSALMCLNDGFGIIFNVDA